MQVVVGPYLSRKYKAVLHCMVRFQNSSSWREYVLYKQNRDRDWHRPLITEHAAMTHQLQVCPDISIPFKTCFFQHLPHIIPQKVFTSASKSVSIHLDVHEFLKHQRLLDEVQHLLNRSRPANVARSQHCHLPTWGFCDLSNHRWQHDMCQSCVLNKPTSQRKMGGKTSKLVVFFQNPPDFRIWQSRSFQPTLPRAPSSFTPIRGSSRSLGAKKTTTLHDLKVTFPPESNIAPELLGLEDVISFLVPGLLGVLC